jgi:chromosome segregation protein
MILTPGSFTNADQIEAQVERLAESRRALERLGDVHLGAIDEYAEVSERHADLETQRADLESSVARIRTAIAKMNRTCRQRFRDTFDLVNQHFQEMYPRLVGGGSARLSLTDEEDLLETGVDIFVQPPGKRLQNLSLLSGGEKAMTAIALILSLFKVKPSPFCVLDEVDAPLDEANGSRFNEALREMAMASQFIVVTHNRKTMECAAALYGITMQDPGVSALVSVSLGD